MNKKLLIGLFAIGAVLALNTNTSLAAENPNNAQKPMAEKTQYEIAKPMAHKYIGEVPPALKHTGPGPQIDKKHPMKLHGPYGFAQKQEEMEKRLKLTDEQKNKIEEQRKLDHAKIKPIITQIKTKRQEIRTIIENTKLSDEDKSKQTAEKLKELDALKLQADNLRKENMTNFENLLTEKQKKEFEKIKKEQAKERAKHKKQFDKKKKNLKNKPKKEVEIPVQPKPLPEKK